jgi:hypothetical protein
MADKKYLITIIAMEEDKLENDRLEYRDVPDEVYTAIQELAPQGALDVEVVYLLDAKQKETLIRVLERNSLPYPEYIADAGPATPLALVVKLDDRRPQPPGPSDGA